MLENFNDIIYKSPPYFTGVFLCLFFSPDKSDINRLQYGEKHAMATMGTESTLCTVVSHSN